MKNCLSFTTLIFLCCFSSVSPASDFLVTWGHGQYDSRTSTFTQYFCSAEKKKPQSVKLMLSKKEITTLINAAEKDGTSTEGAEENLCFTSGVGSPDLTIFTPKGNKGVNLDLCESKNTFVKTLLILVYKSKEVQSLDRPNCRGTVRRRT